MVRRSFGKAASSSSYQLLGSQSSSREANVQPCFQIIQIQFILKTMLQPWSSDMHVRRRLHGWTSYVDFASCMRISTGWSGGRILYEWNLLEWDCSPPLAMGSRRYMANGAVQILIDLDFYGISSFVFDEEGMAVVVDPWHYRLTQLRLPQRSEEGPVPSMPLLAPAPKPAF